MAQSAERVGMESAVPFEFRECMILLKATGQKAATLRELCEIIARTTDESIINHTYQYFLKGHTYQYTNDFAQWSGESLEEEALSEHLSNVDPYEFKSTNDLRCEILRVIDAYLKSFPTPRDAMPGQEFYFNESVTFIYPVGIRARNLPEFLIAIRYVDPSCIYYHFYEARIRLGTGSDDFSRWIETALGKKDLAGKIRAIDPFMHTLEGIREHIVEAVEAEVSNDMEIQHAFRVRRDSPKR